MGEAVFKPVTVAFIVMSEAEKNLLLDKLKRNIDPATAKRERKKL